MALPRSAKSENSKGYRNAHTTHPQKQGRRQRAAQRELDRQARPIRAQLELLDQRPGNSTRERARLMAQLAELKGNIAVEQPGGIDVQQPGDISD